MAKKGSQVIIGWQKFLCYWCKQNETDTGGNVPKNLRKVKSFEFIVSLKTAKEQKQKLYMSHNWKKDDFQ